MIVDRQAVFNEIITDYAEARPGYPNELFEDIIDFSDLGSDSRLLEIGSGPGQATDYFVKNGYRITGLEIGDDQVRYLSEKYRQYLNFNAVRLAFEKYDCPDEAYDLLFSATAFHWIAPEIGYPKAYRLLKSHGTLALFWHMASIVVQETETIRAVRDIYSRCAPELDTYIGASEAENLHKLRISQFQTDRLFGEPVCKTYRWNDEYKTDRFVRLEKTYSDFYLVDEEKRNAVLQGLAEYVDGKGGKIEVPQEVRLYMVRK